MTAVQAGHDLPPMGPRTLAPGVMLFERRAPDSLLPLVEAVLARAQPVCRDTPMGRKMSVGTSNCGPFGWISDRAGYRYSAVDPATGAAWPALPAALAELARTLAAEAGFADFAPDACLINRYDGAARMGLHQDRDEQDFSQPIVSISFGRSARFRFGGETRAGATTSLVLAHGDVLVFGGPARLMFHGIDRLIGPPHPALGETRINLTLRRAARIAYGAESAD